MKWLNLLLLATVITVSCGQADAPPATEAPAVEALATKPPATEAPSVAEVESAVASEQAAQEAGADLPQPELTAAPATEGKPLATAEPPTLPPAATPEPDSAGQPEPVSDEAVAFNGVYESSYFRGAADAPVTILDYSDFL